MPKLSFFILMLSLPFHARGQEATTQQLIQDAVLPLPVALRETATVASYDDTGNRTVLREGSSEIICQTDAPTPGFFVSCFHRSYEPHEVQSRKWATEGKSREEVVQLRLAAMRDGKLPVLEAGTASYMLQGPDAVGAISLMVIWLPNATAESTGLSTTSNNFRPWLMRGGTQWAHVMMPGN